MSKKILIIDDDQTLVAPLKDGLESIGYKVAVAFDGMQGVVQAHESRPDVIILDYHMPGGGGQSVYEKLRKAPGTAKTPIIFSTVVTLEELKARISPSEKTFFLKKPASFNQVLAALDQLLGKPMTPHVSPDRRQDGGAAAPSSVPKSKEPKVYEFPVRVTYADTDKMGIIYYANYFKYFEAGRTELLRSLGVRYRDLEVQRKLFLPCVEANCRYLAPSRYDDLLIVRTWISSLGRGSIRFENEIIVQEGGERRVARGFSRHAIVNDLWRPARAPDDLRALLAPFVGDRPEAD